MKEMEPPNTWLALAIGGGVDDFDHATGGPQMKSPPVRFNLVFPACVAGEEEDRGEEAGEEAQGMNKTRRKRRTTSEEKLGGGAADRRDDVEGEGGGARKKLRLTQAQSALLETTFRQHDMLTAMQKQELAGRLSLRPRQVEVWFQNRRARTKVKQREVNCEFLKRWCVSLSDENMRLRRELQELQMTCRPAPLDASLPSGAATVTVCASCERAVAAGGGGDGEALDGAAKQYGRFHGCVV